MSITHQQTIDSQVEYMFDIIGYIVTIEANNLWRQEMSQVIRIPQSLYTKLESHAQGFDTPANVIERLLVFYEENKSESNESEPRIADREIKPASQLEIIYEPADIELFKRRLIENRQALVELHKTDGSKETKVWHAEKISPTSDLNGNLRSGYLRNWRDKGIEKAIISIQD